MLARDGREGVEVVGRGGLANGLGGGAIVRDALRRRDRADGAAHERDSRVPLATERFEGLAMPGSLRLDAGALPIQLGGQLDAVTGQKVQLRPDRLGLGHQRVGLGAVPRLGLAERLLAVGEEARELVPFMAQGLGQSVGRLAPSPQRLELVPQGVGFGAEGIPLLLRRAGLGPGRLQLGAQAVDLGAQDVAPCSDRSRMASISARRASRSAAS